MSVTDDEQHVDPDLEACVRREFQDASWFTLAAATAQAHHAVDALPSPHSPGCDIARRREVESRHVVLDLLLAEDTARCCPGAQD